MLRSWGQFPAIFAASRSARRCSIVASTLVDQLSILVSWLLDMVCTFIHQQKHSTKAEQNQLQIKGHRSLGTGRGWNCEDCFRHCLRANCIWCTCVWQNVVTAEQPATPSTVASASSWRLQPGAKQLHFDLCVLHKIPNLDSVAMLPNVAPCCRLLTIIGNTINYGNTVNFTCLQSHGASQRICNTIWWTMASTDPFDLKYLIHRNLGPEQNWGGARSPSQEGPPLKTIELLLVIDSSVAEQFWHLLNSIVGLTWLIEFNLPVQHRFQRLSSSRSVVLRTCSKE